MIHEDRSRPLRRSESVARCSRRRSRSHQVLALRRSTPFAASSSRAFRRTSARARRRCRSSLCPARFVPLTGAVAAPRSGFAVVSTVGSRGTAVRCRRLEVDGHRRAIARRCSPTSTDDRRSTNCVSVQRLPTPLLFIVVAPRHNDVMKQDRRCHVWRFKRATLSIRTSEIPCRCRKNNPLGWTCGSEGKVLTQRMIGPPPSGR